MTRTRARTRGNCNNTGLLGGGIRDRAQLSPDDAGKIAMTVLIAGVLVFIAAPIFINASTVAATATLNTSQDTTYQDGRLGEVPNNVEVAPSTDKALAVTSGTSVTGDADGDLTSGNWTIAATAALNLSADGATEVPRQLVAYGNESTNQIQLFYNDSVYYLYYDNGSANATVALGEPQAGEFTSLVARYNGSQLLLSNGSASATQSLSANAINTPILFDWTGRLEEFRTWNNSVDDSVVSGYTSDPVAAYPSSDRGIRVMFDRYGGDVAQYFAPGRVSVDGGAELGDGVAGPSMSEGTDYDTSSDPFSVEILAGGYLEGQPAVVVDYGDGGVAAFLVPIVILGMLLSVLAYPAAKVRGAI
jgi:hypothetical protein